MGNRASILDVSVFCGQAASRAREAAGRAAAMSSAFHAMAAGTSNFHALFAGLTDEEREEIVKWKLPTPIKVEVFLNDNIEVKNG